MNHWSVNYVLFENLDSGLTVNFNGDDSNSDFNVRFIKLSGNEPVELLEMELDAQMDGSIAINDTYGDVLMIVTDTYTAYNQVSYSYNAEDAVDSEEDELPVPASYSLSNYPNPFNPTTTISFVSNTEISVPMMVTTPGRQRTRSYVFTILKGRK